MNIKLLIMGYGINKKKIKNYIKLNKLEKIVKLIGFKKNPYPYLKKSEVFILTSKYEGLPNVLLEALTLKKFIISTDCPTGPREILKNGKNGELIKVGDLSGLVKKINFYKKNKSFGKKKALNGYLSLKLYDFNLNCEKYLSIINKVIEK
tara:strand:- start:257 stop:706 length:450 start_codon:yes stop_codon:yes gene_type:complete